MRNIECKCEYNFTCGYCLRHAKPYFFTLADGSAIYEIPLQHSPTNQGQAPQFETVDQLSRKGN